MSHGERKDSVCFERAARLDFLTAVLTMLGGSGMYKDSIGGTLLVKALTS
jgi:hypothetical protein